MARNSSNIPPTAIPTTRNGIDSSHTIGHNTNASSASGQHSTSKSSQSKNLTMVEAPSAYVSPAHRRRLR
jgi:hypothetical protein